MTHLQTLVQFLDQTLSSEGFDDSSQNGLQVESSCQEVIKVGLAVDSGLSVIEQAVLQGCQMLIVHHALFWGHSSNINGILGKKIRTLIEGKCSLYASHLPLDGHATLGNNAEILRLLGAKQQKGFCYCGKNTIGFIGELPEHTDIDTFESKVKTLISNDRFLALKFGKNKIKTIAVVSGGAASEIHAAKAAGADLFISGEPKQSVYHEAKELGMNVFFPGHYATETFGVMAVGKLLENKFGLSSEFLDQPTHI